MRKETKRFLLLPRRKRKRSKRRGEVRGWSHFPHPTEQHGIRHRRVPWGKKGTGRRGGAAGHVAHQGML